VFVDLYDQDGLYYDYTATDQTGAYSFANLGGGTYYIHTDTLGAYVEEWYDDVPGAAEGVFFDPLAAGATPVAVAWYQWVVGKDFALAPAASIAGQVVTAGGQAVTNVYVDAYLPDGARYATAITDTNGVYRIRGLAAGTYAVRTDTQGAYVDTWQDGTVAFDVPTPADAGVPALSVETGEDLVGVQFVLAGPGARLGGRVERAGGEPIAGIYVDLTDTTGRRLEFDRTDADGAFRFAGLPPGGYHLGTDGLGAYVDTWYDGALMTDPNDPAGNGADLLVLTADETRTNLVLVLDAGAVLSGLVLKEDGAPIVDAIVDAYRDGTWFDFALTDADGAFAVAALPDGAYHLKVDTLGDYLDEWYGGAVVLHPDSPELDGAVPVTLTNGVSVSGLEFRLGPGAEIRGTVRESGGGAVDGIYLDLFNAAGERLFFTRSDTNGAYRLGGLPAGTYYLATDSQWTYVDVWYDDQVILSRTDPVGNLAQPIPLAPQQVLTGVDFALRRGGSIAGTVTGPEGTPLAYTFVEVFLGTNYFDFAVTDTNGFYRIATLPAGVYYLQTDNADELVNEWYRDVYIFREGRPVEDGATPVALGPDEELAGIDLVLGWGGDIEGTVRDMSGAPLAGVFVDLFDAQGRYYDFAVTGDDGSFAIEVLPPGDWYLGTDSFGEYRDEWYADVVRDWVADPVTAGATPLHLEDGTVLVGILIELALPAALPAHPAMVPGDAGTALVEWVAEADRAYQVERCVDLTTGVWSNAPSGVVEREQSYKPPAAAGIRQYADPVLPPSHAAYRVLSW
jgi:protocatechuate 3,4-dioxygenase beta subunit